ncbi:MAG: NTP transferase domain-containing protein [Thermoanaerobaculaceae bacterium]|nr:NTP transferase domain-containing protein [Thermoanaerobaculaceae bacterium]
MKARAQRYVKRKLLRYPVFYLKHKRSVSIQKDDRYLEWLHASLADLVDEFVTKYSVAETPFMIRMSAAFKTKKFEILLKKWLIEYMLRLFDAIDDNVMLRSHNDGSLRLEDSPIHRYAIEKYCLQFNASIDIEWEKTPRRHERFLGVMFQGLLVLWISLKGGVRVISRRKKYKVMREALWGLRVTGGRYFCDDFLIGGNLIKREDLLLFSRKGMLKDVLRKKAFNEARLSPYAHFYLPSLKISFRSLTDRVIPKYLIKGLMAFMTDIDSRHFSLFVLIYTHFINNALPYEKIFSNYTVKSELGHSYYCSGHVAEAIICGNFNVSYYLMHWSDLSPNIDSYVFAFLGCDKYLLWGNAHVRGVEGDPSILYPIGYVFKRSVNEAKINKFRILKEMGVDPKGKVITFFDESFGGVIKMTEDHYVTFWKTACDIALRQKDDTIVIKPKKLHGYKNLSASRLKDYMEIRNKLNEMKNVYILDPEKWSFIESIGISDLVVTQGLTSSTTIAIICGVEGVYLDQAKYKLKYLDIFKDKIVFDDPDRLILTIRKILSGSESVFNTFSGRFLREYDAYSDDGGIDRLRSLLAGEITKPKKRVGVILQARMGATRLPGKVMMPILEKPMLEVIIDRLKKSREPEDIVVATTTLNRDDIIANTARRLGVRVFRGEEDDVLARYYKAATKNNLDIIVRVTGDCPFADPDIIDSMINEFLRQGGIEYLSNTIVRTYPRGFDVEVFSLKALESAYNNSREAYQREHVTPYIYENFKTANYSFSEDASCFRVTVDTKEDLDLAVRISDALKGRGFIRCKDVVRLLKENPDIASINSDIRQKELK